MGFLGAGSVVLACLLGLLLQTPSPPQAEREQPFLRVTGAAEVAAEPDLAVVTLGVSAQAEQASEAQSQVSQAMQRVIAAIVAAGVLEERIQTVGLGLQPVYSQGDARREGEPRVVGFRASNTVRVRIEDTALVGAVLDAGLTAGANEIQGISFELSDDTAQQTEALAAAVRNARTKAQALADAAGVQLLALQRIEESGAGGPEPMQSSMRFAALEAGTPIAPGQVRVRANVVLTFRIASAAHPPPDEPR